MNFEEQLKNLGLRGLAPQLNDLIAKATKSRWSPMQIIEEIARIEIEDRAKRSLDHRVSKAKLGRFKTIGDFDWNWPTKIDRDLVETCLKLDFLKNAENVVIIAPNGLGKTMIAQNIAQNAVSAGHTVRFTTASQLLLDLGVTDSARALERKFRELANVGLLVIDEVGYLAYDNRNADLLFQLISRRYERRSVVLTTNLTFGEWGTVFPNATSTTALIDRIIHHVSIIAIEGESYRKREAEQQAKTRSAARAAKRPNS